MKLHLKRISIFKLNSARTRNVLVVAAMMASAILLSSIPSRTAAASPVALQCQVGASGTGYAVTCNGALPPDITGTLTCQSPELISNTNGVLTIAQANCSGNLSLANGSIPGNLSATVLTIDTNSGTISASQGNGTLTYASGLSTTTASCQGGAFSLTLSPLVLNIPDGTCTIKTKVLGIGTAQITTNSGSISAILSPSPIVSINSPTATVTASVLGLITNIACGASITLDLSQIIPVITVPLKVCSGS